MSYWSRVVASVSVGATLLISGGAVVVQSAMAAEGNKAVQILNVK